VLRRRKLLLHLTCHWASSLFCHRESQEEGVANARTAFCLKFGANIRKHRIIACVDSLTSACIATFNHSFGELAFCFVRSAVLFPPGELLIPTHPVAIACLSTNVPLSMIAGASPSRHAMPAAAATPFEYRCAHEASQVAVAGDWCDWAPVAMTSTAPGCWTVSVDLAPGRVAFKFVVDGAWVTSDSYETVSDGVDGLNNTVDVQVLAVKDEDDHDSAPDDSADITTFAEKPEAEPSTAGCVIA
jgi:hypothetical protein